MNRSVRVGASVASLGVAADVLATVALFVLPSILLGPAMREPYLETVFDPVATGSALLLVYGIPLVAGLAGYYLTNRAGEPLDEVLVGLLVAGLIFGIGIVAVDRAVTNPSHVSEPLVYAGQALRATGRFVGAGSFGTLSGLVLRGTE
jgi:hypothetical protein